MYENLHYIQDVRIKRMFEDKSVIVKSQRYK